MTTAAKMSFGFRARTAESGGGPVDGPATGSAECRNTFLVLITDRCVYRNVENATSTGADVTILPCFLGARPDNKAAD